MQKRTKGSKPELSAAPSSRKCFKMAHCATPKRSPACSTTSNSWCDPALLSTRSITLFPHGRPRRLSAFSARAAFCKNDPAAVRWLSRGLVNVPRFFSISASARVLLRRRSNAPTIRREANFDAYRPTGREPHVVAHRSPRGLHVAEFVSPRVSHFGLAHRVDWPAVRLAQRDESANSSLESANRRCRLSSFRDLEFCFLRRAPQLPFPRRAPTVFASAIPTLVNVVRPLCCRVLASGLDVARSSSELSTRPHCRARRTKRAGFRRRARIIVPTPRLDPVARALRMRIRALIGDDEPLN